MALYLITSAADLTTMPVRAVCVAVAFFLTLTTALLAMTQLSRLTRSVQVLIRSHYRNARESRSSNR